MSQVIILDTTLRDGELVPGVQFSLDQKLQFAEHLEQAGVGVIEVGYPAIARKDFDDVHGLAQYIKGAVICGLANTKAQEIECLAEALAPAQQGRMHVYTSVRLPRASTQEETVLEQIQAGIRLARQHCADVEWSAFDATRADLRFLCRAIETAIASGATTINLPDSLGIANPEGFAEMITTVVDRVETIDQVTLSVHCHDDLGYAIANSMTALSLGARQVECSVRGLGARRGNADLGTLVRAIAQANSPYQTTVDSTALLNIELCLEQMLSGLVDNPVEQLPFFLAGKGN